MKTKNTYRAVLWGVSLLATLLFIFMNSLQPASVSGEASGSLFDTLSEIFSFLPFWSHTFLRKLAHFCEYALLGAHMAFFPSLFFGKRAFFAAALSLFGVFVASLDEGLQRLVPGRSGMLSDVILDTAGYFFGLFLLLAICFLFVQKKKGKRDEPRFYKD